MDISVIIPAYNEEKRISKTLIAIDSYCKKSNFDYEILVVNDGSTDSTVKVVENLKIDNLKIIDNDKNIGKGCVVRQGLLAGKGKYRIFADADNATPIDQLDKFLPYINQFDVIIGSRSIEGAKIAVYQSMHRRLLGKLYKVCVKSIVGLYGIKDTQCGFKLLNAKSTENILKKSVINGLSVDVEILVIAKQLGYRIKEVPVLWSNDAASRVNYRRMQQMGFDLLRIRWNALMGKYKKT